MKYSVNANNFKVDFEDYDNIIVYEGVLTAKNIPIIMGVVTQKHSFIGLHVIGHNTTANGQLLITGALEPEEVGFGDLSIAPLFASQFNGQNFPCGTIQNSINWWCSSFYVPTNTMPSATALLKFKIDNSSNFAGGIVIFRAFFKKMD